MTLVHWIRDLLIMARVFLDVLAERRRQISLEGWTRRHDDEAHAEDEWLARNAAIMAQPGQFPAPFEWSWKHKHPQSPARKTRRRQLVISCALLIAEIERRDRAARRGVAVEVA